MCANGISYNARAHTHTQVCVQVKQLEDKISILEEYRRIEKSGLVCEEIISDLFRLRVNVLF